MGSVSRILQPRQDWPQSKADLLDPNADSGGATGRGRSEITERIEDCDPLNAAKGAVLGVALGSMIWVALLWALL